MGMKVVGIEEERDAESIEQNSPGFLNLIIKHIFRLDDHVRPSVPAVPLRWQKVDPPEKYVDRYNAMAHGLTGRGYVAGCGRFVYNSQG